MFKVENWAISGRKDRKKVLVCGFFRRCIRDPNFAVALGLDSGRAIQRVANVAYLELPQAA